MSSFAQGQGEGEDVERPHEAGSEVAASAEDNFCVLADEEDDSDSEQETVHIQLGFAEKVEEEDPSSIKWLYEDPNWSNWDGGKIGGKPVSDCSVCDLTLC